MLKPVVEQPAAAERRLDPHLEERITRIRAIVGDVLDEVRMLAHTVHPRVLDDLGLVAALQMLRVMRTSGKPLSKLAKCWTRYPQLVTNVKVREKTPFDKLDGVLKLVEQAEAEVKPEGGRVLLRYSGTEPKARLLIEGPKQAVLEKWSKQICDTLKRQVGA